MMIRAEELRVGNLYLNRSIPDAVTRHHNISSIAESWEPIPLTPEWLERCGFEYLPFSTDVSLFSFYKKSDTFELIIVNDGVDCEYKPGVFYYSDEHHTIKHLHQLQNLYFALTGEELNVKL